VLATAIFLNSVRRLLLIALELLSSMLHCVTLRENLSDRKESEKLSTTIKRRQIISNHDELHGNCPFVE